MESTCVGLRVAGGQGTGPRGRDRGWMTERRGGSKVCRGGGRRLRRWRGSVERHQRPARVYYL